VSVEASTGRARVLLHGAGGRMGRAVVALLAEDAALSLAAAIEAPGSALVGRDAGELAGLGANGVRLTDDLDVGLRGADLAIDFSAAVAVSGFARAAASARIPSVICTTGLGAEAHAAIDALAAVAPVVVAANTSVGVTVLLHLAARATALLGEDYDAEIVELHHRHKVDAPSGTALRLAEAVAAARGLDLDAAARHGRSGAAGPRGEGELGIHAVRAGDIIGEHTLVLAGAGERLELTHRAHARDLFARGALRAARWVRGQPLGRYEMSDVLGLPR
jgi:4-hydroxy-tetrahydrodipicolinate reductase